MWIIKTSDNIYLDPVRYVGPFATLDEAVKYANRGNLGRVQYFHELTSPFVEEQREKKHA